MIVDTLKETLNGGYGGLYGEVVTEDCYRLRMLPFTPQVIFDLGANVGVFARYARSLFRQAKIISVEPNEENCIHYRKFTEDNNTTLIEAAIGNGDIWHYKTSANGAMEVYISEGLGYPAAAMNQFAIDAPSEIEKVAIPTIMPYKLIKTYWRPGQLSVIKIDIEGGENAIFEDTASLEVIGQMDYIAMEIHLHALTGKEHNQVTLRTMEVLDGLEETHHCELINKNFYAIKRKL